MSDTEQQNLEDDDGARTLLIVDDDKPFRERLARAMAEREFLVSTAESVEAGIALAEEVKPAYAIVDLRLDDGNGLSVIEALEAVRPDCRAVILTGYGNIASAVAAIKRGAVDYLAKPADADQIELALLTAGETGVGELPDNPMSADRVRWEHIQRVFEQCDRNVSETARKLRMHRRTLQRILAKHAPR